MSKKKKQKGLKDLEALSKELRGICEETRSLEHRDDLTLQDLSDFANRILSRLQPVKEDLSEVEQNLKEEPKKQ